MMRIKMTKKPFKTFQEAKKGIFPNSFKRATELRYEKQRHYKKRKFCRQYSLMNTDVKILNKILASWVTDYIQKVYYIMTVGSLCQA